MWMQDLCLICASSKSLQCLSISTACCIHQALRDGESMGLVFDMYHVMRRQSSMASSMVAEATEASVADSVQDGASSIDDGSMDGASARSAATSFQIYDNCCELCMSPSCVAIGIAAKGSGNEPL